ncbi:hypothetical protein [Cytobacillus pseudoceanisediminis]|uniref:hypothetical protein n=1 Tax=Cytobacillus pseudoceanisediminis TaxID=3051614 RepID=UPI003CF09FB4
MVSIRTEVGDIWRSESEVDHHSDRRRGNPDEQVRSWSSFGQEKWISIGVSPNHEVKSSNNF